MTNLKIALGQIDNVIKFHEERIQKLYKLIEEPHPLLINNTASMARLQYRIKRHKDAITSLLFAKDQIRKSIGE